MASTYTSRIRLEKQADGENPNSWGLILNQNVIDMIDEAVAGMVTVTCSSAEVTVTTASGTPTTTTTGTPTTPASGTPTATGKETIAQNEVLDLEDSDQEETLNIFENLMATATQKCHDFGLPMFIGICLPPKKYKK